MWATIALAAFTASVVGECGCGYTVNGTQSNNYALFTDLLETDFLHTRDISFNSSYSIGWEPQDYNTTALMDNGPYGMAKLSNNLVPNYIDNHYDWAGPGVVGPDPGLQLWVRSTLIQNGGHRLVPCAEIVSERDDILYGSFRIAMKTTANNGTCSAFFYYRNNSQEVDLEILSSQQYADKKQWPIHLVVQDSSNAADSHSTTSQQLIYNMTTPPGGALAEYNEYRFDWLPGRIDYFVNGEYAWTDTSNVPSTPGSNGNPYWTGGPPTQDAVLTVSYVKAYFNSTNTTRDAEYSHVCPSSSPQILQQTCEIPDQQTAPSPFGPHGNETGRTFFFTQHSNMTENQTVYNNPFSADAPGSGVMRSTAKLVAVLAMAAFLGHASLGMDDES